MTVKSAPGRPSSLFILGRETPQAVTGADIEAAALGASTALFTAAGDCLAAAGVEDGDIVAVDFTHVPAPPKGGQVDICLCLGRFPGAAAACPMLKAYDGVFGPWQMVGTRYDFSRSGKLDVSFPAERIYGVTVAAWDRTGALKWRRAPDSFPAQLGTEETIHGGNVKPMDFARRPGICTGGQVRAGGRVITFPLTEREGARI